VFVAQLVDHGGIPFCCVLFRVQIAVVFFGPLGPDMRWVVLYRPRVVSCFSRLWGVSQLALTALRCTASAAFLLGFSRVFFTGIIVVGLPYLACVPGYLRFLGIVAVGLCAGSLVNMLCAVLAGGAPRRGCGFLGVLLCLCGGSGWGSAATACPVVRADVQAILLFDLSVVG